MKRRLIAMLLSLGLLYSGVGAVLTVEDTRALVEKLYIDEVPEEILQRDTVEGIFAGLDRYSSYFTPEEYQSFLDTMNDVSTVGLGIVSSLSEDGTCLEIITVYEDGAAYAAGIRPGDFILAVDGRPVSEAANLEEAGSWMRGEEGTRVSLSLMGPGGGRWATTLTRAPFVIPYTEYELVDGHIGYISCLSFGVETYGHFSDMLSQIGDEVDHWILDLRDNSGGLTQAAADVAGIFTDGGNQALLRDKEGLYYGYAAEGDRGTVYPVILLVNEQSASASELVAASLRDHTAALIIGSRTYGKGVAQTVVDQTVEPEMFADGDAIRITSYRFYSPEGLTNDRIGVLPHLVVEEPYVEDVAYLLSCVTEPAEGDTNLELVLGSWHWNLNVDLALQEEYRPAFVALLEALWPDTEMILSTRDGTQMLITAAELVEEYGLTEYAPRGFTDAAESDYGFALNALGTYGILLGDGTGKVNPKGELTRAQLCAMLAQLLNVAYAGPDKFSDVPATAWYASSVNAMAQLGFVEGDGTGAFRPDEVLTNEQMIAVLARVAEWLSVDFHETAKQGPAEGVLEDPLLAPYSQWAREDIWLMGMSHVNYLNDYISYVWTEIANIAPQGAALRETTAQSLYRLLNLAGVLVP